MRFFLITCFCHYCSSVVWKSGEELACIARCNAKGKGEGRRVGSILSLSNTGQTLSVFLSNESNYRL